MEATLNFARIIKTLNIDEFGDLIYKGSDMDDAPSQKLKDFGVRFQKLVQKLEVEHPKLPEINGKNN